ncbi:MAG TPA: histidine kinase dimerization/phosphoacceptor domain -containing protein [Gemmatimonadales bacterium]|nr:histidine kinase dimerization/phosphoacceptor domain -containing protein [Gemmatimonadales bacterium]
METPLYNAAAEPNDLRNQLHRAEQEREQALVIAEDAQATVRRLEREMAKLETALVEVRTEAARLRNLVGHGHAELLETKIARARQLPAPCPAGESTAEHAEELQVILEELQVTAGNLQAVNDALQAANATLERRVAERTESLNKALGERDALLRSKDLLIREIDYRVRNSLQLISSLLRLQADRHKDPVLRRELGGASARIEAVVRVHSMLHDAGSTERVQFDRYLQTICSALKVSFKVDGRHRELELEADPLDLPADMAVPLALVVNELVTNAFQHAFREGQPGTVWVQLAREPDGMHRLTVADDGRGLPKKVDLSGRIGLGLQMVAAMAVQLGAKLSIGHKAGARFTLTLPLLPPRLA